MTGVDDFTHAVEVIPGLFFFCCVRRPDSVRYSHVAQQNLCYNIDEELLYEPFFADFGPLNLGKTYRFCQKTNQLLQEAERLGKRLYLYAGPHAHHKANAAVLVGIFQVIYLNKSADDAYKPLAAYKPYVPFRDASCGVSTFHLTVYDCIKGIQKARDVGFIDWNSGCSTWSLEEYEHYEQVENGDLNWIVPGKFVAFSGPAARGNEIAGYRLFTPEDYWDYYRRKGVTTIVRLNKKVYDRKRFLDGGFKHVELYFPDGSCPSDAIIQKFLDTVEAEPGSIAVHCKAGLGRTGVLICCYIMKHYRFTAEEVIGYIRICRPGSVIGPQQNFIREMEARMWQEGEMYRAARGMPKAGTSGAQQELVVAGRSAGHNVVDMGADVASSHSGGSHLGLGLGRAGAYGSVMAGSGAGASVSLLHGPGSRGSGRGGEAAGGYGMGPAAGGGGPGDMSLFQYSRMHYVSSSAVAAGGGNGGYYSHGAGPVPGSAPSGGDAPPTAPMLAGAGGFRTRAGYSSAAASGGGMVGSGAGRSMTPMRYGQQASIGSHGVSSSHPGPLSSAAGGSRVSLGLGVARSMPSVPITGAAAPAGSGMAAGRSASNGRLTSTPASSAALRATLHTDTLAAADRPKLLPERNTQSADISRAAASSGGAAGGSLWKLSVPSTSIGGGPAGSGPNTPTTPPSAPRTPSTGRNSGPNTPTTPPAGSAVARVLAPNGQPRKVPVALLSQYQAANGGAVMVGGGGGLMTGPAPVGGMGLGRQGSGSSLLGGAGKLQQPLAVGAGYRQAYGK